MDLLLDTCTFLWITTAAPELSSVAAAIYADPANRVFLSSISVWEICVKHANGKLPLPKPPHDLILAEQSTNGLLSLPLTGSAALRLLALPAHHRDPFDRMLVCQAIEHGLVILTPDTQILRYGVPTIW